MARRAAAISDDNLELLLDTMCNAFGGVIFIAMLLAVVAQFAEVQVKPDLPEMKTLERQRVELDGKLNTLRTAREQQGRGTSPALHPECARSRAMRSFRGERRSTRVDTFGLPRASRKQAFQNPSWRRSKRDR